MAKNKGTFGKGKSEVEVEDEFIQGANRVGSALRPHAKKLIAAGVVVALIGVGIAVWDHLATQRSQSATLALSDALLLSQGPIASGETAADGEFASIEARAQAATTALDAVGGKVGMAGKLALGDSLATQGKYDEAIEAYKAFLSAAAPEAAKVVALENIGYALEAKAMAQKDAKARQAGLEEALAAFERMQPKEDGPGAKRALYHQGRMLAELERRDEAIAKFKAILSTDPGGLEGEVENRLAALENEP